MEGGGGSARASPPAVISGTGKQRHRYGRLIGNVGGLDVTTTTCASPTATASPSPGSARLARTLERAVGGGDGGVCHVHALLFPSGVETVIHVAARPLSGIVQLMKRTAVLHGMGIEAVYVDTLPIVTRAEQEHALHEGGIGSTPCGAARFMRRGGTAAVAEVDPDASTCEAVRITRAQQSSVGDGGGRAFTLPVFVPAGGPGMMRDVPALRGLCIMCIRARVKRAVCTAMWRGDRCPVADIPFRCSVEAEDEFAVGECLMVHTMRTRDPAGVVYVCDHEQCDYTAEAGGAPGEGCIKHARIVMRIPPPHAD